MHLVLLLSLQVQRTEDQKCTVQCVTVSAGGMGSWGTVPCNV